MCYYPLCNSNLLKTKKALNNCEAQETTSTLASKANTQQIKKSDHAGCFISTGH